MSTRTRTRDPEAAAVAEKIVTELAVNPAEAQAARLGAIRGYSEGKSSASSRIARLEASVVEQAQVIQTMRASSGFTPGEARYIEVLGGYGLTVPEIADVLGVSVSSIRGLLSEIKNPVIRFRGRLQPGARRRVLQT